MLRLARVFFAVLVVAVARPALSESLSESLQKQAQDPKLNGHKISFSTTKIHGFVWDTKTRRTAAVKELTLDGKPFSCEATFFSTGKVSDKDRTTVVTAAMVAIDFLASELHPFRSEILVGPRTEFFGTFIYGAKRIGYGFQKPGFLFFMDKDVETVATKTKAGEGFLAKSGKVWWTPENHQLSSHRFHENSITKAGIVDTVAIYFDDADAKVTAMRVTSSSYMVGGTNTNDKDLADFTCDGPFTDTSGSKRLFGGGF